ncbi:MAG: hypothetical protein ACKOUR_08615, partial [Planctomycetota bacterium]
MKMPEKSLLRLLTAIVLAVSGDLVMVGAVFLRTPWLSATAAAQESPIASPLAPPPAQVEA